MNLRSPSTNRIASLNVIMSRGRKGRVIPISMSVSGANNLEPNRTKQKQEKSISFENVIDKWMKDSVVEIVKNLREVPLLVHVYPDKDGESPRLKTEKAMPDNWPMVKSKWEDGTTPLPEGVIFVEQLKHEEVVEESDTSNDFGGESDFTRAWGIVVQAKGENCGPSCYLLKTSRAGPSSGAGLGLCCTHFCLMKVKSFRETAEAQFKNCWLLNSN